MFVPRFSPSKLLIPSIVVVAIFATIQSAQGKSIRSLGFSNFRANDPMKMRRGGCAAFGHSCFGGHGKRSEASIGAEESEEASGSMQPSPDEVRSLVNDGPRPLDIFSKDQPENDINLLIPSQYPSDEYIRFSPLFRKWLSNSYRRGDLVVNN